MDNVFFHHSPTLQLFVDAADYSTGRDLWPAKSWKCSSCQSPNIICAKKIHSLPQPWTPRITLCYCVGADTAVLLPFPHFTPAPHWLAGVNCRDNLPSLREVFRDIWMMSLEAVCRMQVPRGWCFFSFCCCQSRDSLSLYFNSLNQLSECLKFQDLLCNVDQFTVYLVIICAELYQPPQIFTFSKALVFWSCEESGNWKSKEGSMQAEADVHRSAPVDEAGGVIYAQPVGGRERWASKGPALISDLVWLCPVHTSAHILSYDWRWTLTPILEQPSALWWMGTHRCCSFCDLKTVTCTHSHKLWWEAQNAHREASGVDRQAHTQ